MTELLIYRGNCIKCVGSSPSIAFIWAVHDILKWETHFHNGIIYMSHLLHNIYFV